MMTSTTTSGCVRLKHGYRILAGIAGVALGAAACGSDDGGAATATGDDERAAVTVISTPTTDSTGASASTMASSSTTETPDEVDVSEATDPPVATDGSDFDPAPCSVDVPEGRRALTLPTLGGVCTQLPEDVLVTTEGDYVGLSRAGGDTSVVIARVSAAGETIVIENVEDLVDVLTETLGLDVTVTETTRRVVGSEMVLYEVRGGEPQNGPGVLSKQPPGFGSNLPWSPVPAADLYLGDVRGGVLVAGIVGPDPATFTDSRDLLDAALAELTLTTSDDAIAPLPSLSDILRPLGEPKPFTPMTNPDGAPPLPDPFSPIDPGRYQMPNIGLVDELAVEEGWFLAPNFPGQVVLTDGPPRGPGVRDIQFLPDVTAIIGTSVGPTINTDAEPITDIDAFVADPPENLVVSNVDRALQIDGRSVTRLDIRVDPSATCAAGDPCSFTLVPPTVGVGKFLVPGATHRLWWVDDPDFGPLAIGATTSEADADWLDDRADEVVESLTFV